MLVASDLGTVGIEKLAAYSHHDLGNWLLHDCRGGALSYMTLLFPAPCSKCQEPTRRLQVNPPPTSRKVSAKIFLPPPKW